MASVTASPGLNSVNVTSHGQIDAGGPQIEHIESTVNEIVKRLDKKDEEEESSMQDMVDLMRVMIAELREIKDHLAPTQPQPQMAPSTQGVSGAFQAAGNALGSLQQPGSVVPFQGGRGSGKSTMSKLMQKLNNVQ